MFKTIYQMLLYRMGLVLRSEYDRIVDEYQKLRLKETTYERPE